LKQGGAKFDKLDLKYYTVDYRGVHSKARLERDEIILQVPLPLIMTSDVAKESAIGRRIRSSGCQLRSSHSWLACMLLQEKSNPNSFYAPYIQTLPQHYRNMPIFFDDEELKMLTGSFTLKMISDRKVSLKAEYDNIVRSVPEFAQYHHLEFFWARLAVITRIFGFEVGTHKTDGLVAMADMLNHKRPNETSWHFDNGLNAFTITTTKRLLKGAQIFDSYGRKCNSRYFVNYGFSLDVNEDNQVALFFQLPRPAQDADEAELMAYQLKAKLIGSSMRRFQIPFEHKEKVTRKCVSFLRVAYATVEELVPLTKLPSVEKIEPISIQNEAKVMYHLARQAEVILAGFPTTLEEDNKELADPESKLTMNGRFCKLMCRGEKEVLHAYIDLDRTIQHVKDMDHRTLKKYLASHVNNVAPMPAIGWRKEMYFSELWIPLLTGNPKELEEMNNSLE
jgi:histone-lysine N-methyltransferase SETD3